MTSSSSFSGTRSWQRWRDARERDSSPGDINAATTTQAASEDSDHSVVNRVRGPPRCPKIPSCNRMCSQRIPRGRAFALVLVMLVAERYILYGAVDQVLGLIPELPDSFKSEGFDSFLRIFLFYCVSRLFYPVGGFLADVYMGRCRVIHMSLWLYWIAFTLLTLANVLHEIRAPPTVLYTHILPIAAYVFVILASGGFESTLIPFGADQLEAAGSSELSSYFYWYYIAIQTGVVLNVFVSSILSICLPEHVGVMKAFATLVVATLGLILHKHLQQWYFRNALRENCIKLVLKVLWYVARVRRQMPQYRRAFRYGEGRIRRIELAKWKYDGKFSGDQVEDVKTFCMVFFILFCLGGYFFAQTGVGVMLTYRMNATLFEATGNSSHDYLHQISSNAFIFLNCLIGLLFVPLVNHIFIPCVPSLSMRGRMGIGMTINVLAIVATVCVEAGIRSLHTAPFHKILWFIVPTVLITLPEVLTAMSALEFVYAQSPESMKGMLTGLFYFIFGVFNGGSTTMFYFFIKASSTYSYYYLMLLVFAIFGLSTYITAACLYVNRQRPTRENEEGDETQHFYDNISIPKSQ